MEECESAACVSNANTNDSSPCDADVWEATPRGVLFFLDQVYVMGCERIDVDRHHVGAASTVNKVLS